MQLSICENAEFQNFEIKFPIITWALNQIKTQSQRLTGYKTLIVRFQILVRKSLSIYTLTMNSTLKEEVLFNKGGKYPSGRMNL